MPSEIFLLNATFAVKPSSSFLNWLIIKIQLKNSNEKNTLVFFRVKKLSWEDELAAYNGGQVVVDDDCHGP